MLEHIRYTDIRNYCDEIAGAFHEGDHIIIQEKLDGANVSFQYDAEFDSIQSFSRNQLLDENHTLRFFYNLVQTLDKERIRTVLGCHLRVFGEWLVKHVLPYPADRYETVYCFDVLDMETGCYLPQHEVKAISERLGLAYVPVFFEGRFTAWEDYLPFVRKTALGGEMGEGIVIKNMSHLQEDNAYLKIVHERFREVKRTPKQLKTDAELIEEREQFLQLAETIVTRQRVEKILCKLVDEGTVPEMFTMRDMQLILKNLPSAVQQDCIKEEPRIVSQIRKFDIYAHQITVRILKEIIAEKES